MILHGPGPHRGRHPPGIPVKWALPEQSTRGPIDGLFASLGTLSGVRTRAGDKETAHRAELVRQLGVLHPSQLILTSSWHLPPLQSGRRLTSVSGALLRWTLKTLAIIMGNGRRLCSSAESLNCEAQRRTEDGLVGNTVTYKRLNRTGKWKVKLRDVHCGFRVRW